MLTIIRHMVQELIPQSTGLTHRSVPYTLPSHTPILKVLSDKLHDIFNHGCIDIQSIHQMAYLLNIGGTLWFCENTVKVSQGRERSDADCFCIIIQNYFSHFSYGQLWGNEISSGKISWLIKVWRCLPFVNHVHNCIPTILLINHTSIWSPWETVFQICVCVFVCVCASLSLSLSLSVCVLLLYLMQCFGADESLKLFL